MLRMNGASVVASLPLTSPLITPSTGEAEPRGSSCVLYDAYNTFCTIHIRNVLNATNEGASGVCRTVQVVNPSFYPSLCPYIHGEKTPPARRPHHDIGQSAPHHDIVSAAHGERRPRLTLKAGRREGCKAGGKGIAPPRGL